MHTLANLNNTQFLNEMQINVQVYWFTCKPTAAPSPPPLLPPISQNENITHGKMFEIASLACLQPQ